MSGAVALKAAESLAASSSQPSFFRGQGKDDDNNSKTRFLGSKKKITILGVIIALMTGGGIFLSSSHSLLAPALENLLTTATDTQNASYQKRVVQLQKFGLKGDEIVSSRFTGGLKYGKMTSYMKKRLAAQGIEVEGRGKNRVLKWNGETITADGFVSKMQADVEFRDAYFKAKRGRVANFFDTTANKKYSLHNITRNLFKDYKQTGDAETDMKAFRETISKEFEGNSTTIKNAYKEEETTTSVDEDGNEVTTTEIKDVNEDAGSGSTKGNDIADAETKANGFVSGMANKAAQAGDGICSLMQVGNLISTAVAANQIYQSITYFMSFMENPSKMMAGNGMNSGINEMLNNLTTSTTAEITEVGDVHITKNLSTSGKSKTIQVTGAPIEANGLQMMLAGAPADSNTSKRYSNESVQSSFAKSLGMSSEEVRTCTGVNVTSSGISIASSISMAIASGGISFIGQIAFDFVVSTATAVAISAAISFIVPTVAKHLFTNIFETATGVPAGNLLASGAAAANMNIATGSGQGPGSSEAVLAYNQVNQEVLAWEAESDRINRSPFDTSSQNTFLGSIAYSLLPFFTNPSSTTTISKVSSLSHLTSSSIASLTDSASAAGKGENTSYLTTFGDCSQLDTIGVKGDIYCNPITISDPSTLETAPDDSAYLNALCGEGGSCNESASGDQQLECDEDGNCKVVKDSDLAKYISYCTGRESPYGIVDANILDALEKGNVVLNSIPVVGDVLNIMNAADKEEDTKWATGEKCKNSSDNPDWKRFKYFQRYIEDQRILEQMGVFEDSQNPVLGYIEEYEAEHPIDNSFTGYIARISGMRKSDAETVLATVLYYDHVASYDPSDRIAMDGYASVYKTGEQVAAEISTLHAPLFSDNSNSPVSDQPTLAHLLHPSLYADVRNRNYAIA